MKIKKGDKVIVIAGKDKGKKGTVMEAFPSQGKVIVEGIGLVKKHQKPRGNQKGGIVEKPMKIDVSNVSISDPKTGKPTRIGYKTEGGKKVRYSKKTGVEIK